MFPVWFDLFSVYLHSPFSASIIFESLLGDIYVTVLPPFTHLGGNVGEIFNPLGVSLGESLESRMSPCS